MLNFKFLAFCQNFGLRLYRPSAAVAIAEGEKPLATAVDLQPSVDLCLASPRSNSQANPQGYHLYYPSG